MAKLLKFTNSSLPVLQSLGEVGSLIKELLAGN